MLRRVNDHELHRAAAETEIARFIEVTGQADLTTPVPTCPGWTFADLIRHHGTTHRWITHIVRTRPKEQVWSRDVDLGLPADVGDYPAWLAAGVEPLLTALRETDGATPTWTYGPDQQVRFYSRRVLYEAAVHRADAEIALGLDPVIAPETAADGIEEFLTVMLGLPRVAESIQKFGRFGETLHLHATDGDGDGEWMITLGPDGTTWERGHAKGTVAVRGTTSDLFLLVWGRLKPERLTVFGDQELLSGWLAAAAS